MKRATTGRHCKQPVFASRCFNPMCIQRERLRKAREELRRLRKVLKRIAADACGLPCYPVSMCDGCQARDALKGGKP